MENQQEIWKDIPEYEGLYQVSNFGRVKGLKIKFWAGCCFRTMPERILKPNLSKWGYFYVVLHKNKKPKTWKVHRLVALTFIPNLENKKCIDHINGFRVDNRVCNLRWCTHKENLNNPITKERQRKLAKISPQMLEQAHIGYEKKKEYIISRIKEKTSKPVICIETNKNYLSISEAAQKLNICRSAMADGYLKYRLRQLEKENEIVANMLVEELAKIGKPITITDLMNTSEIVKGYTLENGNNLTNQKISAIFKQLVESNRIVKVTDKKKSYFSIGE